MLSLVRKDLVLSLKKEFTTFGQSESIEDFVEKSCANICTILPMIERLRKRPISVPNTVNIKLMFVHSPRNLVLQ